MARASSSPQVHVAPSGTWRSTYSSPLSSSPTRSQSSEWSALLALMASPVYVLGLSAYYHDSAACLLRDAGAEVVKSLFVIELDFLQGREKLRTAGFPTIHSLLHY